MRMLLATNNKNKLKEIRKILVDYEIKSLKDVNLNIDIEEDGKTFYENAYKKAKAIYEVSNIPTIADDSGLCIDILDGFPGVMTHRFLGEGKSDIDRNNALIEMMKKYSGEDRNAKFICDLVYYDGINIIEGIGVLNGKISANIRGDNGFGFDSIFELSNGKTLAELTNDEKNIVSARYMAVSDLKKKLRKRI